MFIPIRLRPQCAYESSPEASAPETPRDPHGGGGRGAIYHGGGYPRLIYYFPRIVLCKLIIRRTGAYRIGAEPDSRIRFRRRNSLTSSLRWGSRSDVWRKCGKSEMCVVCDRHVRSFFSVFLRRRCYFLGILRFLVWFNVVEMTVLDVLWRYENWKIIKWCFNDFVHKNQCIYWFKNN